MRARRLLPVACLIAHVAAVGFGTNLPIPRPPGSSHDCAGLYAQIATTMSSGGSWQGPSLAIRTPQLRLTEFEPGDLTTRLAQVENMLGTPEHLKLTSLYSSNPARLKEFARDWANYGANERYKKDRNSFTLAVRDEKGNVLGMTNLSMDRATGIAEFGFVMNGDSSGKGYGTEVAHAMVKAAFENLGAKEVHAEVHVDNVASQRVMEKAGFERSGRFVTNTDTEGNRKRFEVWTLSRRNYDRLTGNDPGPRPGPGRLAPVAVKVEAPPAIDVILLPEATQVKELLGKHKRELENWTKTDRDGRYLVDDGPVKAALSTVLGIPTANMKMMGLPSGTAFHGDTIVALDSGTRSITLASTDGGRVIVPESPFRRVFEVSGNETPQVLTVTRTPDKSKYEAWLGTEKLEATVRTQFRGSGSIWELKTKSGATYVLTENGMGAAARVEVTGERTYFSPVTLKF